MKVYDISNKTFTFDEVIDIVKKVRQRYPETSRIPWDNIIANVKDEMINNILKEDPEKYLVPEGAIMFD